jgi:hypothetical protein
MSTSYTSSSPLRLHRRVVGLLYLLPSITIRIIKTVIYAGHVRRMWEMINAYRILVGKPVGKIQFEDPHVFRRIKIN